MNKKHFGTGVIDMSVRAGLIEGGGLNRALTVVLTTLAKT